MQGLAAIDLTEQITRRSIHRAFPPEEAATAAAERTSTDAGGENAAGESLGVGGKEVGKRDAARSATQGRQGNPSISL
ncbi:hypothetical protein cyc_07307 [Cyclospora cayetanensis]|uniref:Uncharacterized protein n=1 Tax=Cyclospora cayetanensis TaxID=88456 RepID=A0A1D3CTM9_9EIME|nr:hypothetical protein cyc_07307 [Cyclospora cayetanensis]